MDTLFEGLQEIMDELRRFIEVDNHEAVKIGDLVKNSEAIKVVGLNFDRNASRRSDLGSGGRIDTTKR